MFDNNRDRREPRIMSFNDEETDFLPFIEEEDVFNDKEEIDFKDGLPVLPLRNTVLLPGVLIPIQVGREKSLRLLKEVYAKNKIVVTVAQRDAQANEPGPEDLYKIGTIAQIIKILEMPDNTTTVIIRGRHRCEIEEMISTEPYFVAKINQLPDANTVEPEPEFTALLSSIKDLAIEIIQLTPNLPDESSFAIKNIDNQVFLVNFVATNSSAPTAEKQLLLETDDLKTRANKLLVILLRKVQELRLKETIQNKVKNEIDAQQREFFLNQQIKTIQDELGISPVDVDIKELKDRAASKKWKAETAKHFERELQRLHRIHQSSPEYSTQLNYLQILLDLPWNEYTADNFELNHAQDVLDEDHYGMEKIKERIIEHLAVLKLKGDLKAPILCLTGPPGVGKTSLGRSIARALNRSYVRIALGGLHDEAEIRGHRKTYIGSMPGRIIQNLIKAKSSNPVFILDEIDKIGNDFRGDPSFALLEVLDPEQNHAFYDNYLEIEFDLSKVMFIATANNLSTIKPALRDRMEIINISGYILEEKVEIAKQHLIPKQLENHGLTSKTVKFPKDVIEFMVDNYTRESGVRELDQKVAKVMRNLARRKALDAEFSIKLTKAELKSILGPEEYLKEQYKKNDYAGVAVGLAWTANGGEILYVETSLSKGKGGRLTLTGNLGEVMKESAVLALEYIKAHAGDLGIHESVFDNWNIHVHVPEGAIPKDGPSAGITMVHSLASAFTQRKVKSGLAMTGEITLRGKILPVGGIKEKILAAKRAGISEIVLSKDNQKDVLEVKPLYIEGLKFHYVDTIQDALEIALSKEMISKPLVLNYKAEE